MKTDFLLQVINRKNLNCLVKIAILFGWEVGVGTFCLKTSRKTENPKDQFPFYKFVIRLLRNRRGKSAKNNRERIKKRKVMGVFTVKKLNSEGRNQNGYYAMEERILSIILLGIEEGNPFILVQCLWGVFLLISVLLRIGDGVVVWMCLPYSFVCRTVLCAIVRLFYLTLLCPRLKLGCRQV
jgi:hypothetical protein